MSVAPGTRVGSYEILAELGRGGMGEVYRARDTKLDRDVALKMLPDVFAGEADRVARFEREAKTLASLNHPNIAHVYDAGSFGGGAYLAMELVEGDDLSVLIDADSVSAAGRMGVEPDSQLSKVGLPLAEALSIAKQIATALEAAHEQGVVHRDLKPANVKVRPDGTVKVLDFGLAKALGPDGTNVSGEAMNSPTLTARMTQMGVILGTAAYMAPEQAKGKPVDKRADIWAFGVVFHEMLTRQPLFLAETIPETLAHVMTRQVDLTTLPETTPRRVRELLARCLEKDPKRRLRDIGEARLVLEDPALATPETTVPVATVAPVASAPARVPRWQRIVPWTLAAAGLAAVLIVWAPWQSRPAVALKKLRANIGAAASLMTVRGAAAILSPDATTLAFSAAQEGQTRLFIRKMDQLQAVALAGTEGAESPFFSPNGQWVAFFAGGKLKKVQVTGGAVVPLCDAPAGRGGTWGEDDTIIFSPATGVNVKLQRVPAAGGNPEPFGGPGETATTRRWPQILPGGTHVLFTEHSVPSDFDMANLVVAPLAGGPPKVLVRGAYNGRYVQSGHLLFMRLGSLYAVPFDLGRLETTGAAVPAVEGVVANAATGSAQFSVSVDGTLVYTPGSVAEGTIPIHWMTRDGKSSPLRKATLGGWAEPRFSPDGQRLALAVSDGKQEDIWVYEPARDTMTQLTFDPARDRTPVWSPTGDRILFSSNRANPSGPTNLYWTNSDGTGQVTRLTDSPNAQVGFSWHPNGRFIFFQESNPTTGWDLMVLPIEGDAKQGWKPGKPTAFLATPTTELYPKISPDGRWLAYFESTSNATDVFVRPFPGPGEKFRVSTGGGYFPTWSEKTPELVFPVPNTTMLMVARYSVVGDSFRPDTPQPWGAPPLGGLGQTDRYTLHPDGKRLVAAPVVGDAGTPQNEVVFFFNFFDYLRSIAPRKK